MKRPSLNTWLYAAALAGAVALLGMSAKTHNERLCERVDIALENQADNFFLDLEEVKQSLQTEHTLVGSPIGSISLAAIEQELKATQYVEEAIAVIDAKDVLHITVKLRRPIARVIDQRGKSFYLDADGTKIPLSRQFTARCPLVRGAFTEPDTTTILTDSTLKVAFPMIKDLWHDEFFRAQVAELYLNRYGEATIYPQVGDMTIDLGSLEGYREKLRNLMAFYDQVAARRGWDYYESISLRYRGQVVARRSNYPWAETTTDQN